ncbi:MAG TPA: CFI-box-CTERM domain-containing protein [Candidatus Bathyarchaeia archaeon]|nr:CFI-box-CTERM domain-containing protein [Candidatus Bathyarchaeia archaeon]
MFFASRFRGLVKVTPLIIIVLLASCSSLSYAHGTTSFSNVQAASQNSFGLSEWNVPTAGAGPWWITSDQSGKIWFTENITNKIGRFDPSTNTFTEWSIPGGGSPRFIFTTQVMVAGTNFTRVYFTLYSSNQIAYFDSWNGTFHEWSLPSGSTPLGLYVDMNETVWFTESGRDAIGSLAADRNQLKEWTLPGATGTAGSPLLRPWGIYAQPFLSGPYLNVSDRYVWFTEANSNSIGRLQASNGALTIWDLSLLNVIPGLQYGPTDLTIDSTTPGNVLFTDSLADKLSVLTNAGGGVYREYTLPAHASIARPTSLSIDGQRGVTWFNEYNPGNIGFANTTTLAIPYIPPAPTTATITPTITIPVPIITTGINGTSLAQTPQTSTITPSQSTQSITEYPLPNSTAQPNSVNVDPSGNVWFTESNPAVNKIGRLSTPYVFQISTSPSGQVTSQNGTVSYTVSVSLISGIAAPVQLSLQNVPMNVSANLNPLTGTPPFTSTLTVSTSQLTTPGTYTINVVGTSGTQSETSAVTLTVQGPAPPTAFDYEIDVTGPSTLTVQQGQSTAFNLQTSVTSGTTQTVNLSVSGLPLDASYSLSTTSGEPPFGTTLNVQTSLNTPGGSYPLLITGVSNGGQPHHPPQSVVLVVSEVPRDFSLTSVNSVNLVQGSRVYVPVTVTAIGYFQSNVSLSGSFSPSVSGMSVSFNPSTVAPPFNGTSQVVMEITAVQNTAGVPYQLTVTGTSNTPSLAHQITVSVNVSPCLIATASFGSSTAPEVQFLRSFRDNQIMQTFAGSMFMKAFNSWYYSFSPNVAHFENSHSTIRSGMRMVLYPLLMILHLSSWTFPLLANVPELAVLSTGILASFLIGFTYGSLPFCALLIALRRRVTIRMARTMRLCAIASLAVAIGIFAVSEVFIISPTMMVATVGVVLSALALGAICPALVVFERLRQTRRP